MKKKISFSLTLCEPHFIRLSIFLHFSNLYVVLFMSSSLYLGTPRNVDLFLHICLSLNMSFSLYLYLMSIFLALDVIFFSLFAPLGVYIFLSMDLPNLKHVFLSVSLHLSLFMQ